MFNSDTTFPKERNEGLGAKAEAEESNISIRG
eukprot:CAMPEP_0202464120 /NCGR_PEP_ID=MMETSP1360-20130828/60872_1 /ASSEMBLY_ACC=CAM_ASM_000848 /TAXON_ID=515479 /ORGANISM="Licmophora paradoxa, Strain CCMP2313" /LENGTH=31 /DNA_ID=CAMNT_0049087297 /DNA_START=132 /DNA_END=224 /DNA_ORIENTATION=+